ncbi:Histone deacetylase superfamily [Macleaya cordata]|uniref:histone deacetylase n=1 Tax=Macleaya cordata TaxID=56857 RepID=A0A200PRH5_MACCD|nr:Histone deacetylase superfamily [Macleaya cordata]
METDSPTNSVLPRVGLVYDDRMCQHSTPDREYHPENPYRIKAIWTKLKSAGIPQRCVVMKAKEAEDRYIALVHKQKHIDLIRNVSSSAFDSKRKKIASKLNSIYLNEGSSEAAYLAAGAVIEVSEKVAKGELDSAVAIVRPPGHHAEPGEAMGFCLFNNVAIAASFLLNERPELGIHKILIVDWDVHHGNGTQKMFWEDPRVLFFSVHRFDNGTFYPSGDDGSYSMTGEGLGAGYNINVPWEHGRCGDADYFAVWEHVLIPVAKTFNPDMILISGGFDAAVGDPLGGCCITPYGYSVMMKKLMEFAQGRIVMALEGGYNLDSLSNSVLACVKTLLEDKPIVSSSKAYPFESTWRVIQAVRKRLSTFWPTLADELPKNLFLTTNKMSPIELISSSDSDVENNESEARAAVNAVEVVQDVAASLSVLKIDGDNNNNSKDQMVDGSASWRSVLSKIDIWYGSFGSNMWKPRFLCYIEGGQVEGMQSPCSGSVDRSPPKEIMWKTVPHRLFFGRSRTRTWGAGGVAFLHPESDSRDRAYMCLYKITLEQFNDVLVQENRRKPGDDLLFNLTDLDSVMKNKSMNLEALKEDWYSNVVCLGTEGDLPILTMTCPLSDIELYRSGKLRINGPSKEYMNVLVKGLVEGRQLSEEEAIAYINEGFTRPLSS